MNVPVCFFHGLEDTVVPWEQSKSFYEELKKKGVPTYLRLFQGEGHGFRGAKAIRETTEASFYFLSVVLGIRPAEFCEVPQVRITQPFQMTIDNLDKLSSRM